MLAWFSGRIWGGTVLVACLACGAAAAVAARAAEPPAVFCDMVVNTFLNPRFYVSRIFSSTETAAVNEQRFYAYLNNTVSGGIVADHADPATCVYSESIKDAQAARQREVSDSVLRYRSAAIQVDWP